MWEAFRVVTWNVLHRVHGMNWKEAAIEQFPDEPARTRAIAARVSEWLHSGVSAVCLQEVSGDQLAALREVARGPAQVIAHRYPRIPRAKGGGDGGLSDGAEHLVTVVAAGAPSAWSEGHTFASDPGKGALAVEVGAGVLVIGTHVSFGQRAAAQLEVLAGMARSPRASRGAVVMGDFNASADVIRAALGDATISDVAGQRPSRPASPEKADGHTIDHVVVVGGVVEDATVLDGAGLSDHEPVSALVRLLDGRRSSSP